MNIDAQDLAAIASLGYTEDEARFLYIVASHSGYFVPRQFLVSSGAKWRTRSSRFAAKLESRGHVTWREYDRTGGVYHLVSKTVYRRINKENLYSCRRHSVEFIRTRLLLLDFILANQSYDYLDTEPDKMRFFSEELRIPQAALPAKTYEANPRSIPTLRYFVDKFPLFLDRSGSSSSSSLVTFSYVDPGRARLAGFANHVHAYLPLFRQLGDFSFLYIADSPVHFVRAEELFSSLVARSWPADVSDEIVRYFGLRQAWETKKYGSLSTHDIEWLKEATHRFDGERFDGWYSAWTSGALSEHALRTEVGEFHPRHHVTFRTCLVTRSRSGTTDGSGEREGVLPPTSSPEVSLAAPPAVKPNGGKQA
jgi:hypothetical protein